MSFKQLLSAEVIAFKAAHIQKDIDFNMKCLFSCCELVKQSLRTQQEWTGNTNQRLMKCLNELSTIFLTSSNTVYERSDNTGGAEYAPPAVAAQKNTLVDEILNDGADADEDADADADEDADEEVEYHAAMKGIADAFSPTLEQDHIRLQKMIDERRKRLQEQVETIVPPPPKFRVTSGDPTETVHMKEKTVALPPNSSEEAWEEAKNAAGVTNEDVYNRANEALLESLTSATPQKAKKYKPLDCGETAPEITRMSKFNTSTQEKIYYEIHCKAIGNIDAVYGKDLPHDRAEELYNRESDRLLKEFLAYKINVPSAVDRADMVF